MKARIWSRKSWSERKLPRLSSLRTRILSQISTWFIKARMLWCVVKHNVVRWIMQKGGPAFHGLQDAALALDTQRLQSNPRSLSYPAHQRFRLMDVEIVQDDVPLRSCRRTSNQALEVGQGILLGARRSPGWFDDLSGPHVEIDEPGQRAMPDILEFASQHMTGLHGQVGILALERLDAGQFIGADGAFTLPGSLWSTGIHLTPLDNLFVSALIGNCC